MGTCSARNYLQNNGLPADYTLIHYTIISRLTTGVQKSWNHKEHSLIKQSSSSDIFQFAGYSNPDFEWGMPNSIIQQSYS
jgi:hypothetical protein